MYSIILIKLKMTLSIWKAIGDFCTDVLFKPYDFFRDINNSESWWAANTISIVLFAITVCLFVYWYLKMIKFFKEGTE